MLRIFRRTLLTVAVSFVTVCAMTNRRQSKKPVTKDWHPADIVAAIRKAGWTLRRLSQHHGYSATLCRVALDRPYPRGERFIAEAIGVPPQAIWPSRYHKDGRHAVDLARSAQARKAWVTKRARNNKRQRGHVTTEVDSDNGNATGADRQ